MDGLRNATSTRIGAKSDRQKRLGFFGVPPRPRNEKPGAVSRAGLDTLFKDALLYLSPVTVSTRRRLYPKKYFLGTPTLASSNEKPGAVSRPG